ncbi:MAG: sugar kinase [Gaiellaceae bacterium]
MAATVVTFGEAMLRLSPAGRRRLEQVQLLEVWPAGAELNVAVGLARLGTPSAWVSRLPRNALGQLVASQARSHGVDTSRVRWDDGGRLGLYFVEVAAAPRASAALYDRSGSSFARLEPDGFDWPTLLAGARLFHTSGITPALSEECARATTEALAAARAAGCTTSYDLNFRAKLTTPELARDFLGSVAGSVDVLLASAADATSVFGAEGTPLDVGTELRGHLGVPRVVVSARVAGEAGTQARVSVSVGDEVDTVTSPAFGSVDPVGGGDAFCAGFLHGLLEEGARRGLELGGAMAALKQSIPGDFPLVGPEEVEQLLAGTDGVRMTR